MLDIPIGSSSRKEGILEIIKVTKLGFVAPISCKMTVIYFDMTLAKFLVISLLMFGEFLHHISVLYS
jgi:hypothetical protein